MGGDEFAALAVEDVRHGAAALSNRLQRKMNSLAATVRYRLSRSVGMTRYVVEDPASLDEDAMKHRHLLARKPRRRRVALARCARSPRLPPHRARLLEQLDTT